MDVNDIYGINGTDSTLGAYAQSGLNNAQDGYAQNGMGNPAYAYARNGMGNAAEGYAQNGMSNPADGYAQNGMGNPAGVYAQNGMVYGAGDYDNGGVNYAQDELDVIGIDNNRGNYYQQEPYEEAGHYGKPYEMDQYGEAYSDEESYHEESYGEESYGEESYDGESGDEESDLYYKRKEIIEVARYLYDIGLIVRTWGNVSARIDNAHFLITPSGIRYEDLTPEMIPIVRLKDMSYQGDYIPSSESKVHAACYKTRPECKFIVHTHQVFASCAGALGMKRIATYFDDEELVIPVVPYGYPGTEKLADNVAHSLRKFKNANAVIMANHGTVCLGQSSREAVYEAQRMEIACNDFLIDVCNMNMTHGVEVGFNSHLEGEKIVYDIPDTPERVKRIHEQIYSVRPDVKYIIHNKSEAVVLVSRRANHMRPLLDDFAQLIGTSVNIPKNESELYHNIRKTVNVVFSPNDGAYCFGPTEDDAQAVALVLDKGCIAYTAVLRNGEGHYVPTLECILMNRNYRKNYSKLADKVDSADAAKQEETEDSRYEQYDADAEYADEFDIYEEDNADFLSDESLQQYTQGMPASPNDDPKGEQGYI
ncbi:MAG: class II aldolase/adducin family protein [Butyrivibrio sp.]|nr:class II aldolase/adducin family protein [Butyrivibrio sp.]